MEKEMFLDKSILWVDDEIYHIKSLEEKARDFGLKIIRAYDASEGLKILEDRAKDICLIILDVMMPIGKDKNILTNEEIRGGYRTGLAVGRIVKEKHPNIPIIGYSILKDKETEEWFNKYGFSYLNKGDTSIRILFDYIKQAIAIESFQKRKPRMFIVHGHDHATLYELKNYLQNTLGLGESIILHEKQSYNRTIIEKFEDESQSVDLVFVLLTPDDKGYNTEINNEEMRARQNVIFEMGYFFGKMQRKKGNILLLYKGELEVPSDIYGIVYINISKGIEAAGEILRRELSDWL